MTANNHDRKEGRSANSGFAKKRVQWLIEHSTSHQILWYVDSFVLRNPLLRKAANRWWQCSVTVLEFKSDRIMTKQFYRKYGQVLNLTLLILWTILTPSHFQKGGVVQEFYIAIAVFVTAVSFIITLPVDNLHWQERISISILFAFVSLFITTLIIGPKIVDIIYSDKTWNLWETKHRIFMNSVFYGLNTIILSMLYFIYFKAKAQSKNRKKLKRTIT